MNEWRAWSITNHRSRSDEPPIKGVTEKYKGEWNALARKGNGWTFLISSTVSLYVHKSSSSFPLWFEHSFVVTFRTWSSMILSKVKKWSIYLSISARACDKEVHKFYGFSRMLPHATDSFLEYQWKGYIILIFIIYFRFSEDVPTLAIYFSWKSRDVTILWLWPIILDRRKQKHSYGE